MRKEGREGEEKVAQEFGKRGAVGEVHVIEVHNAKSWKKITLNIGL